MTEISSPEPRLCQNCDSLLQGNFCSNCGQADKHVKRPLFNLLKELAHAIFELDGRAYKTLLFLFARPGFLSKEYVEDRRVSYTPPLRLFLILSILLFFTLSFNSFIDGLDTSIANIDPPETAAAVDATEASSETDSNDAEDDIASDIEELEVAISELVVPFITSEANSRLTQFILTQTQTNYRRIREDPSEFIYGSLEYITAFLLLMMPLMALIQAILYIGRRRYYVEHFVLTLHNHTFLILLALINLPMSAAEASSISLISWPAALLSNVMTFWMIIYLYLSMKRFYGGGYLLTALKFVTATVTYSVLLAVGLAIFMAINFILF